MSFRSPRRLDHLVLPTRDLEAQAELYRRLGFQVGARNRHPWGTENRLIQFDGCFLELISLSEGASPPEHAPGRFSFGAHVRDWIGREGAGMAMLAIDSPDAEADARWFRRAGIGGFEPFRFARQGVRPDGTEAEVAFSLAFAAPSALGGLGLFACQQHFPENFWSPALQAHDNGATGVARVIVLHDRPLESLTALKAFAGGAPEVSPEGLDLAMANGILSVWTPEAARARLGDDPALFGGGPPRFAAASFAVGDLERVNRILNDNGMPHRVERTRLLIPSGAAFGVLLLFEAAGSSRTA